MIKRRQRRSAGRSGIEGVVASMLPCNIAKPKRGRNEQRREGPVSAATLGAMGGAVLARRIVVVRLAVSELIGGRKAAPRSESLNGPRELDDHERKRNRQKVSPQRKVAPLGTIRDGRRQVHRIRGLLEARAGRPDRQARKSGSVAGGGAGRTRSVSVIRMAATTPERAVRLATLHIAAGS
jgi:hypothetical protein